MFGKVRLGYARLPNSLLDLNSGPSPLAEGTIKARFYCDH
jgi:hypothetical protein